MEQKSQAKKYVLTDEFTVEIVGDDHEDGLAKEELLNTIRTMVTTRSQEIEKNNDKIKQLQKENNTSKLEADELNDIFTGLVNGTLG